MLYFLFLKQYFTNHVYSTSLINNKRIIYIYKTIIIIKAVNMLITVKKTIKVTLKSLYLNVFFKIIKF